MTNKQAKDIELLWQSAEHWLNNWQDPVNGSFWAEDCPLCLAYVLKYPNVCTPCPIAIHTNKEDCVGTPYWDARQEMQMKHLTQTKYISDEYTFLVSLALSLAEQS